jgi:hypothetical protein
MQTNVFPTPKIRLFCNFCDIAFRVRALEGESYVSELPNGSLGGIGGQLMDGKADLAIPLSYILPYRQAALTALHPIAVDRQG